MRFFTAFAIFAAAQRRFFVSVLYIAPGAREAKRAPFFAPNALLRLALRASEGGVEK
ncbi:hypothetical protein [Paraburkholderia sp. J41]|uniref:hypothetical protein n=1 Tax=Paraburkholderia sp. J41 TaxID=2805433 RepID=UPI002AC31BC6|nr:hypothetical protein [Paraburkholderia sp. J41]